MGDLSANSEVNAKVEKDAVTATVTDEIIKHEIIGLQDEAGKDTIHGGGITEMQDEIVRATIREGPIEVTSFLSVYSHFNIFESATSTMLIFLY